MPKRGRKSHDVRKQRTRVVTAFEVQLDNAVWLFVFVLAACTAVIVVVHTARQGSGAESWDKVMFVGSGVTAVAIAAYAFANRERRLHHSGIPALVATAGLLVGIGAIEPHAGYPEDFLRTLWGGWGPYVLALTLVLALSASIWRIVSWATLPHWARTGLTAVAALACVFGALSLWQTRTSLIDPGSAEYYVNELLAPAAGHVPYADFIPQYQTLFSWLVVPFARGRPVNQVIEITLAGLSVMGLLAVAIGVWLAHIALGRRSLALAALLVVPFTCVVQFPFRPAFTGSIASQLSGLPTRVLNGMLLAALAIPLFDRLRSGHASWWRIALTGLAGGLYIWNSQDFGVAANVTVLFLLAVIPGAAAVQRIRVFAVWLVAIAVALLAYPALAAAFGRPLDSSTFFFFVRQFGSGFGAEAIQLPGPVLVTLPLVAATTVTSVYLLWGLHRVAATPVVDRARYAAMTGAFFGGWAALGFAYYLNRSFASGQMQVLFLPLSVGLAGILGAMTATGDAALLRPGDPNPRGQVSGGNRARLLHMFPLTLVAALPIAAVLAVPNPAFEWRRITRSAATQSWPTEALVEMLDDVRAAQAYAEREGKSIGYFGEGGNYVQLATGIASANLFNNPFDLFTGERARQIACDRLTREGPDFLAVSNMGIGGFRFANETLCGRYAFASAPGVREGHFAARIE